MPAASPPVANPIADRLQAIGQHIRAHRRALKVSATTAAAAAGLSRVTLHRIERGEPSVTIGAYLNAVAALGLVIDVMPAAIGARAQPDESPACKPKSERIRVGDYDQLRRLAWHISPDTELEPAETLGLYERNWRHVETARMDAREARLLDALVRGPGKGRLLV